MATIRLTVWSNITTGSGVAGSYSISTYDFNWKGTGRTGGDVSTSYKIAIEVNSADGYDIDSIETIEGQSLSWTKYSWGFLSDSKPSSYTRVRINYKAKSKNNFELEYFDNGGSGSPQSQRASSYDSTYTFTISSTKPTRDNYDFKCWNTRADGKGTDYSSGGTITVNPGRSSLYAKWSLKSYTITANVYPLNVGNKINGPDGKDYESYSKSHTYGSKLTFGNVPATGYVFKQWETSTGSYLSDKEDYSFNVTGSKSIVCRFELCSSKIIFDKQGGSGGTDSITLTYSSSIPSITVPKWSNTTFKGYYSGTNGQGTKYYNADGTPVLKTWYGTSDITLYAYWVYTINAVVNDGQKAIGSTTGSDEYSIREQTQVSLKAIVNTYYKSYKFSYWLLPDGKSVSKNNPLQFYSKTYKNSTFTAYFELKSTEVKILDSTGGSGYIVGRTSKKEYFDVGDTVYLAKSPNTGYYFDHWHLIVAGEDWGYEKDTDKNSYVVEAGAKWVSIQPIFYKYTVVEFYVGVTLYETQYKKPSEKADRPTDPPAQEHYRFEGWYNGTTRWDFDWEVGKGTLKLDANFEYQEEKVHTVTLTNYGELTFSTIYNFEGDGWYKDYWCSDPISKLKSKKEYYKFNGFEVNSLLGADRVDADGNFKKDTITSNETWRGKWSVKAITVTLDNQGGKPSKRYLYRIPGDSSWETYGFWYDTKYLEDPVFTTTIPEKGWDIFGGYLLDGEIYIPSSGTLPQDSVPGFDYTVIAKWTDNSVYVNLAYKSGNGDEGMLLPPGTTSYKKGDNQVKINAIPTSGAEFNYQFEAWWTKVLLSYIKVSDTASTTFYNVSSNTTYYASFTDRVNFKISDTNGGQVYYESSEGEWVKTPSYIYRGYGDLCSFRVELAEGYKLTSWTVTDRSGKSETLDSLNPYVNYTITRSCTITANVVSTIKYKLSIKAEDSEGKDMSQYCVFYGQGSNYNRGEEVKFGISSITGNYSVSRWEDLDSKEWNRTTVMNSNMSFIVYLKKKTDIKPRKDDTGLYGNKYYVACDREYSPGLYGYNPYTTYNPLSYPEIEGNCTWYAQGRSAEIAGRDLRGIKNSNTANGDLWWTEVFVPWGREEYNIEYLPGDILCWEGGSGLGHVEIVEGINDDGTLMVSYSNYGHGPIVCFSKSRPRYEKGYEWDIGDGKVLIFQGVIHNPYVGTEQTLFDLYTGSVPEESGYVRTKNGDGEWTTDPLLNVEKNSIITLEAVSSGTDSFNQWWDGNTNNPRSYSIKNDTFAVAYFGKYTPENYVLISLIAGTGGSVSGGGTIKKGEEVTITATPDEGYKFIGWSNGLDNEVETFNADKNEVIRAVFGPVKDPGPSPDPTPNTPLEPIYGLGTKIRLTKVSIDIGIYNKRSESSEYFRPHMTLIIDDKEINIPKENTGKLFEYIIEGSEVTEVTDIRILLAEDYSDVADAIKVNSIVIEGESWKESGTTNRYSRYYDGSKWTEWKQIN